jgi:hypothetical protein
MEIPDIGTRGIGIDPIDIPVWDFSRNVASPNVGVAAPVTVDIGVPIVNMPGCVEAHEQNNPRNDKLIGDDPKGTITFCDAGVPNFNPMDFKPNEMIITRPPNVDTRQPKQPKTPPTPEAPQPKTPVSTDKIDCPTPAQQAKEPVGAFVEGFRKKVTDYKLIGNECIQITEEVPLPQQIIAGLPAPGVVTTTATIAIVATTSALMAKPLADLLLKVVKPTVKKVIKKIAAIRGKSVPVQSLRDRQAEQRLRNHAIRKLKGKE